MFEKIKQQAMHNGMKLLSNPKVAQMMADPRFLSAITRGLEIKGMVQSEIEGRFRAMAASLQIATRSDLSELAQSVKQDLRRDMRDLEVRCGDLERKAEGDPTGSTDTDGQST